MSLSSIKSISRTISFSLPQIEIWVAFRVLALLKNNNDNALSLSFKIGNGIMQYYIINNDIVLIMHYRANSTPIHLACL